MKKFLLTTLSLFVCAILFAQVEEPQAVKWTFGAVSTADASLISQDASWNQTTKNSTLRYQFTGSFDNEAITANGEELDYAKGLKFTVAIGTTNTDGRNLYLSSAGMWLGENSIITVPDCKAGQWVLIEYATSKDKTTRSIQATNIDATLPTTSASKTHVSGKSAVTADGDVTFKMIGGMYVYSIVVAETEEDLVNSGGGTGGGSTSPANPDNPQETVHEFDITQDFSLLADKYIYKGEGAQSIYVAPDGDDANDGLTPQTPIKSIQLAVDRALDPGTTIYLAPGEYNPADRININDRNGKHDMYNAMVCLDGRATIKCAHPQHGHSDNPYQGIRLTSSYWYMYHVDITNASDNGMLIERNKPAGGTATDVMNAEGQAHDNIIHACNFYKNGDTGLQMKNLAAYNYIINCDSYLNCDENFGDADGFAPKISVGTGNYFYGCRAYLNSDDGWDVFYKNDSGFGDNMTIIIENCISYKNGFLDENTIAADGNGNGFKCGSDQGAMNVILNRCLAVQNKLKGFDQNHNSGDIIMNNCTGYVNTSESYFSNYKDKAYSYRIFEAIATGHKVEMNNCIAINDNEEKDKRDSNGVAKPGEHGKNGNYSRFQVDEELPGLTVSNCEFNRARPEFFKSLDHTQLIAPRVGDELPEIDFGHINPEATAKYSYVANKVTKNVEITAKEILINNGKEVNNTTYTASNGDVLSVSPIAFIGNAPDLGAYETDVVDETGVEAVGAVTAKAHGALYNIAGQKVGAGYKGIVISNGVKVMAE